MDSLGMISVEILPWIAVVIGLSLLAAVVVWRKEKDGLARLFWLALLVCVPILAPIAAVAWYSVRQRGSGKEKSAAH